MATSLEVNGAASLGGAQQRGEAPAENLCLRERLCHCGLQWRRRRDGRNSIGYLDPMGHQIETLTCKARV